MAKVLSAGGFADEAPALLGKSIGGVAQALLSKRGVAATTSVGDDDIRRLIDEAALPAEAWTVAEAARSAGGGGDGKQHRTADRRNSAHISGR
jgi:hypothetical protein